VRIVVSGFCWVTGTAIRILLVLRTITASVGEAFSELSEEEIADVTRRLLIRFVKEELVEAFRDPPGPAGGTHRLQEAELETLIRETRATSETPSETLWLTATSRTHRNVFGTPPDHIRKAWGWPGGEGRTHKPID
jgi:hypothetical protein